MRPELSSRWHKDNVFVAAEEGSMRMEQIRVIRAVIRVIRQFHFCGPRAVIYGTEFSHPPVKPARRKPAMMYGFFRINRQMRSLRQFSIISRIGPWSMPR